MRNESGILGILVLAFAAAGAPGCGSNACEDADARYEECGLTSETHTEDCTGEVECWAGCVADADCDTLTKTHISDNYKQCIADCSSK